MAKEEYERIARSTDAAEMAAFYEEEVGVVRLVGDVLSICNRYSRKKMPLRGCYSADLEFE